MIGSDEFAALMATRYHRPEEIAERFRTRVRSAPPSESSPLLLIAADHPARGSLEVGHVPTAMGDRRDLLQRVSLALSRPGVDGVVATADVLEDLLLLGALDGKFVIGSMNRGGLRGSTFECDDRFTGLTPTAISERRLEGGKMMVRVADNDAGTVRTLESVAKAIDKLAERELTAIVEVFAAHTADGHVQVDVDPEATARAVAIVSGLGSTSAYTWLKLPVTDHMEQVVAASTLPVLLLGGDVTERVRDDNASWLNALQLPQVRGLILGRTILFPPDGDIVGTVDRTVKQMAAAKRAD